MRVHGHRGARAILPENTVPGFVYAIELGVDAIELDVVVTKDDVVVVSHDGELAGSAVIRKLTLEELHRCDARIPTLDEVLSLSDRGPFVFHIEIKTFPEQPGYNPPLDDFAKLVMEQVHRHGLAARSVILSFDFAALHAVRRIDSTIRLSALYEPGERDYVSLAHEAGAQVVSPHYSTVTPEKVKAAQEAGLEVVAWTVNAPEDWRNLMEAEVDAIVADDPAALMAFLATKDNTAH